MTINKQATVTLTFHIPSQEYDLYAALRGASYKHALSDMDNYLRARLKYEELPDNVHEALQAARDHLLELTRDADSLPE